MTEQGRYRPFAEGDAGFIYASISFKEISALTNTRRALLSKPGEFFHFSSTLSFLTNCLACISLHYIKRERELYENLVSSNVIKIDYFIERQSVL